jgi:hypothetical protein
MGLYESLHPPVYAWFFHTDFSYGLSKFLLGFIIIGLCHPAIIHPLTTLS